MVSLIGYLVQTPWNNQIWLSADSIQKLTVFLKRNHGADLDPKARIG